MVVEGHVYNVSVDDDPIEKTISVNVNNCNDEYVGRLLLNHNFECSTIEWADGMTDSVDYFDVQECPILDVVRLIVTTQL